MEGTLRPSQPRRAYLTFETDFVAQQRQQHRGLRVSGLRGVRELGVRGLGVFRGLG